MRGGAQAHLMRAADGHFYVVKFQNNPQHLRVLANELLATKLAEKIGLPVPAAAIVQVGEWLIQNTPDLTIELGGMSSRCQPGLQFGSRFVVDPMAGQVLDYLPESFLWGIDNLRDFAGVLAFDKWTCNANGRQAVFWRKSRSRGYRAAFVDQGYCFNNGEWAFRDTPLRGVYSSNRAYAGVTGWDSFEPWLSRIEKLREDVVWQIAEQVPPEWYGGEWETLEKLLETLLRRCSRVPELITDFRKSSRQPFPAWED